MTDNSNKESRIYSQRLVIVTGDKGGVGKSTFARAMLQTYLDTKQNFTAFDADTSNPQIKRFYDKECSVLPVNIFKSGETDAFLDDLKTLIYPSKEKKEDAALPGGKSLFLLELPSQSIQFFRSFEEEMGFFSVVEKKLDMRVTMAVVINRTKDSVNQLKYLRDFCGNQADYIVIKNLFFGDQGKFERYDNSSLVKELKEANNSMPEICLPELIAHAYDYLDENNYSYAKGIEQSQKLSVQGRVSKWMENFKRSIEPTKHLLGLKDVSLQPQS